jgi:hypothetical protein
MEESLQERAAAAAAWTGRPRKSAQAVLLSVAIFVSSIVLSPQDGRESTGMIILRAAALIIGFTGTCVFFNRNIDWRRLRYTFENTKGVLWSFWLICFCFSGLARPSEKMPIFSVIGTVYMTLGLFIWLSFESVHEISRIVHVSLTVTIALGITVTIYLTAFVWQDDAVLADFNGVGVEGIVTRYAVHRTCFINMLVLIGGSLKNLFKKNWRDNIYFTVVEGPVSRQVIMELESLSADPDGYNSAVMCEALAHRISRHSSAYLAHAKL